MEPILANLMKVQGVLAAAVFASDDACLEFTAAEPIFEPIMFLAAMRAAEDSLDVFRTMDRLADASSFTCELEHGLFAYRTIGGARLGVMAASGVNVAMLDVAIGVATLKLTQAEQRRHSYPGSSSAEYAVPQAMGSRTSAQYAVPAMPPQMPPPMPPAMPPPMPAAPTVPMAAMASGSTRRHHPTTAPPPMAPHRGQATGSQPLTPAPGTSSGLSPSLQYEDWRPDELLANGARVPGTIGPTAMQHVLRSLARYLGGHAKAVIVEELAQLGATPATARPELFTDLIYNVAGRIPDPGMHDEFVKTALGDRR